MLAGDTRAFRHVTLHVNAHPESSINVYCCGRCMRISVLIRGIRGINPYY